MAAVTMTLEIERPVEDVFAVLTHVELASRWSSAISEELITPGPMQVGSRRRAVVPGFAGRTSENVMELTELVPNRRLGMRAVSGVPFPFRITIELHPRGAASAVTWTAYLEPRGVLRPTGPLVAAVYGRLFARDLQRLKAMMEAGTL
jgi:uncharacterized protein YndB with AHSA1/START domain